MALMLALSRRLFDYVGDVRAGRWAKARNFCFLDYPIADLNGKTLVLVGAGSLGESVAVLARAFGMKVVRAERPGRPPFGRAMFASRRRLASPTSSACIARLRPRRAGSSTTLHSRP